MIRWVLLQASVNTYLFDGPKQLRCFELRLKCGPAVSLVADLEWPNCAAQALPGPILSVNTSIKCVLTGSDYDLCEYGNPDPRSVPGILAHARKAGHRHQADVHRTAGRSAQSTGFVRATVAFTPGPQNFGLAPNASIVQTPASNFKLPHKGIPDERDHYSVP